MKVKSREWICGQCKKTYATEKEAFSCWLGHGIKKKGEIKMKNDELLKVNSKNEDYPNTDVERIGYAVYAAIRSLEPLSPAIRRLQRCEEMFKINAPNIIKHHEAEEALKYLAEVKQAIDDAYNETRLIYHSTKEKDD